MSAPPSASSQGGAAPALETARAMSDALALASAGSVRAVLLYGSHLLGARPDKNSALDLVVVVSDYRAFYGALHDAGELHRSVWVMTRLSRLLPPNVIAYTPGEGAEGIAKCLIVSPEDLRAALGPRPKDHFLLGRLIQKVALVWAATAADAESVERLVAAARDEVLSWIGPYLAQPFGAEAVGRRILEVCYRSELRPEARDRSSTVFEVQREHFRDYLDPLLQRKCEEGVLVDVAGGYRFATPWPPAARHHWDRHFRRSKVRATSRWLKHVITFDNWLPYVHRKAERRLGVSIVLTPLERRWPLVFLWPRVVRLFLSRPDREGSA